MTVVADIPDWLEQWDDDRYDPYEVFVSSKTKVYWRCEKGHSWVVAPETRRSNQTGCPYCSGRYAIKGETDVFSIYPELEKYYSPNNDIDPSTLLPGSSKKVLWSCPHNHPDRLIGVAQFMALKNKCPYCSGDRAIPGKTDLATCFPNIAKEWDKDKNKNYTADTILPSSTRNIWWVCSKGHSYKASPRIRTEKNKGCHFCSGRVVLPEFNDLETLYPSLAQEMDDDNYTPDMLVPGSRTRVRWVCSEGHQWFARVKDRVQRNDGCGICKKHALNPGTNDLATIAPQEILEEFDEEKNGFPPSDIAGKSSKKVWWKCSKNPQHSWLATVANRVRNKTGCPYCYPRYSRGEKELGEFLASIYDGDIIQSDRFAISPKELDFYLPDISVAFEYNGLYWHSDAVLDNKNFHLEKYNLAQKKGIDLFFIWEDEWKNNKQAIKNMIASKIGKLSSPKVFARNTHIQDISLDDAREFCNKNHIQGFKSGSLYWGLFDKENTLVAVSVWRVIDKGAELSLERYCTSCQVVGGMGKMLKKAKEKCREEKIPVISTFSDKEKSNGNLYRKLGFTPAYDTKPDYKYIVGGERKHKFGYRIKRFKKDTDLFYEEGLTESELAKLNGLHKVWDCGKTKWIINIC